MLNRQQSFPKSATGTISLSQPISVCSGQSYTLSAYAMVSGGSTCYLQICAESSCGAAFVLSTIYAQDTFMFNGGSSGNAMVFLNTFCTGTNARIVYLDSVSVMKSTVAS
jgi:hypothetical protein